MRMFIAAAASWFECVLFFVVDLPCAGSQSLSRRRVPEAFCDAQRVLDLRVRAQIEKVKRTSLQQLFATTLFERNTPTPTREQRSYNQMSLSDTVTSRDGALTSVSHVSSTDGIPDLVRGDKCGVVFVPQQGAQYCRTTSPPRGSEDTASPLSPIQHQQQQQRRRSQDRSK